MDVYSVQRLYILGVLVVFGSVLTQTGIYMVCPSEIWEPGATITLQCFVEKLQYPARCETSDGKKVIFNLRNGKKYSPMCTLTDIRGSCKSTGDCRCGTGNSTYYLFEYKFLAATNKEGYYWDCFVDCYRTIGPALSFTQFDCENRKVNDNPDRLKQELLELRKNCGVDTESGSSNTLVIGLGVAGAVCAVMVAISLVIYFRKRGSGGHQNAPPDNAPQNNAPLDNAVPDNAPPNDAPPDNEPPANAPLANGPPFNSPPFNSPPDNDPQVAGQAGPSTGAFPSTDEANADGSEASEASEVSELTASEVGEVEGEA